MRVTLLGGFIASFWLGVGPAAAQDDVRAVIDKGIAALGGEKNLAAVKGVRVKGKGTLHVAGGLAFTDETIQSLDKYKSTFQLTTAKQTVTTGWDSTDGSWIDSSGQPLALNAKLKNEIKNNFHVLKLSRLVPLQSGAYELSLLDETKVDDRPVVGIKVSSKDYADVRLYFDKETNLLVKTERRAIDEAMKEINEERIVKSYLESEGMKWPKKIETLRDGVKFMDEETISVELIEQFEATAFAKPVKKVRPQEPKKPYPYVEEEVTYENTKAKVKFAGTLTLPPGDGPFPAVLLITGSGAQDRNEEIFNHRPFLVLADHLTRRGIAVLRVDDRGVGGTSKGNDNATSEDFAEDVRAGVAFLKTRKEIDPKRVGLIGHSEGGLIAPMVAADSNDVAFIVLLAGPGVSGEQIMLKQGAAMLKATGIGNPFIARNLKLQQRLFEAIRAEKDEKALEKRLRDVIADEEAQIAEDDKKMFSGLKAQAESQIPMLRSAWLRFFLNYDPRVTLRKVRCPVLAANGEKDLQVDIADNLTAIRKALEEGRNGDFTIKQFPNLNHLFQTCELGTVTEYGRIEETFAPAALEYIGDWIVKRTAKQ